MRWKQFLTPVKSINVDQAREYREEKPPDELTFLDVRQPKEYETGHIPGAKLIPLPEITSRIGEIDPDKATVVYCAVGGRSRIAAQMMAAQGFGDVYNLSGGFKAWKGEAAFGTENKGLELFTGNESVEKTLIVAYSLEEGLRNFYFEMKARVNNSDASNLFEKLSEIEIKHQNRILEEYSKITEKSVTREEFEKSVAVKKLEGGLTTEEYANLFHPDWESVTDIIEVAMSIEAQALDLYLRASERAGDSQSQKVLRQIADEERTHLAQLGKLIESI
ncbi:rhodanese-related sulfurtransferase [Candidatus Scalindua japonica]|uniref:Rhodanese-related sulfurtransferase n=1 Tax=Candidatus Scalindua japonica TaxID=1284222 RepID=A0A286U063_9BACT|nr:rhodanese-like domain-containing protein [Candidatus Scalindua japonica]GAX61451.1 rhodanese-related sulfurtransferase [Candidatus Scalindua japonica]